MVHAIIVDDEPAVAEMIRYFVKKERMPIEIVGLATNGKQALELIDNLSPKIVFLDIQMPVMNGFEVMQARPDRQYIVITAYESFRYAQKALRLGAKDIILKPIEFKQLLQAVTSTIGWQVTDNELVNDVLEHLHNYYNEKIELNKLAEMFFVTPSHLARLFKKHTQLSLISYINKVRIEKACAMLEEGKGSVKTVAEQTGYESLNNFYKYFKIYTGMTPAVYCKKEDIADKINE